MEKWINDYKGQLAETPKDAAKDADFVFTCVGNDKDLEEVTIGKNGLYNSIKKGAIYIHQVNFMNAKESKISKFLFILSLIFVIIFVYMINPISV